LYGERCRVGIARADLLRDDPCPAAEPAVSSAPLVVYWASAIANFPPIIVNPATTMLVPLTATAWAPLPVLDGIAVVTIPCVPKPASSVPGVPVMPLLLVW